MMLMLDMLNMLFSRQTLDGWSYCGAIMINMAMMMLMLNLFIMLKIMKMAIYIA